MRSITFWVSLQLLLVLVGSGQVFSSATPAPTPTLEERVARLESLSGTAMEGAGVPLQAYWKRGLVITSADRKFEMTVRGRLHLDAATWSAENALLDRVGKMEKNAEIRRARIGVEGLIYGWIAYKLEYDFADSYHKLTDGFVQLLRIPLLSQITIGQEARAFGLDPGPSSNYQTFLEAADTIIFGAGRQLGISMGGPVFGERASWAAQVYQMSDLQGQPVAKNYNLNARLTSLPVYADQGETLMHLGLSYSRRSSRDDMSYSSRPEIHLAPTFVDTGQFAIDGGNVLAYEAALAAGPFLLQGEYYTSYLEGENGSDDLFFQGFYALAAWTVTGESTGKRYVRLYGEFDSPFIPAHDFDPSAGNWGGLELAGRVSWLDLDDGSIEGGKMLDLTAALNWYLYPELRLAVNYVHSHLNGVGDADIVGGRCLFYF